jgi:hypothetical protein
MRSRSTGPRAAAARGAAVLVCNGDPSRGVPDAARKRQVCSSSDGVGRARERGAMGYVRRSSARPAREEAILRGFEEERGDTERELAGC